MAITGTTQTCQILVNTPFVLSGLTQTNLSTINITDENGLDVSECFGITTNIIKVEGDNISTSGDCNTSLEITITSGIVTEVECLYTAYTEQQNGLLLFEFVDGTTSDNIHPDCCTALGYEPEIGDGMYYVCRSVPEIDPTDCNNYTPTNTEDVNGYQIFDFVTGGTVTTVPSAECCYAAGYVESVVNGEIKCIVEEPFNPCGDYVVVEPIPTVGYITFVNTVTGLESEYVPSPECCTSLGFNFTGTGIKTRCYQSINDKPTVSFTNDTCCQQDIILPPPTCYKWNINVSSGIPSGEGFVVYYIDCGGVAQIAEYYGSTATSICVQEIESVVDVFGPATYNPTTLTYQGVYGSVSRDGECGDGTLL